MRPVAVCFVFLLALSAYDQLVHHGLYRAHTGKMVGHMVMSWK